MEIKDAIKFYRKRAGMTQLQLAELVGVKRSTIARYERGDNKPSVEMLNKISGAIGVDLLSMVSKFKDDISEYKDLETPDESAYKSFINAICNENGFRLAVDESSGDDITDFDGVAIILDDNFDFFAEIPNKALIQFWERAKEHASVDFKVLLDAYKKNDK